MKSKCVYPKKLSSPPSPDRATVTNFFASLFSSKEGNAETSAKGSSYTFTKVEIKFLTSAALHKCSLCFEPMTSANFWATLLSSNLGSSKQL